MKWLLTTVLLVTGCESLMVSDVNSFAQFDLASVSTKKYPATGAGRTFKLAIESLATRVDPFRVYTIDSAMKVEPIAGVRWSAPLQDLVAFHFSQTLINSNLAYLVTLDAERWIARYYIKITITKFHIVTVNGVPDKAEVAIQGVLTTADGEQVPQILRAESESAIAESSQTLALEAINTAFLAVQGQLLEQINQHLLEKDKRSGG